MIQALYVAAEKGASWDEFNGILISKESSI